MEKIRFDDFVKLNRGFDLPDSKIEDGVYPVVASTNVKAYHSTFKVNGPMVVTGRSGSLGAVQYIDGKCWPLNTTLYVKDFKGNNPRYVYYFLKTMHLEQYNAGAGVPTLNQNHLHSLKIEIHEKEKQSRIASILSAYDNLIENNNKRIRLLEQMAENLYKEWFVRFRFPGHEKADFENGLPKGWRIVRLSDYADIVMGQSPESEFYNNQKEGLPFHQGVGSYGDFYLKDDVYATKAKKIAEPDSIIFSVRAPVGRINITLNRIILGRGVSSINAKDKTNAYLFWMLKNMFAKEDLIGNGSIFTSVTKEELFKQKITLPNDETRIKFNKIGNDIEKEIRNLSVNNQILARQRDLLLPRLMSGKLEVKL